MGGYQGKQALGSLSAVSSSGCGFEANQRVPAFPDWSERDSEEVDFRAGVLGHAGYTNLSVPVPNADVCCALRLREFLHCRVYELVGEHDVCIGGEDQLATVIPFETDAEREACEFVSGWSLTSKLDRT